MDLPDATLMFLVEAAGYPAVAGLARSAHEPIRSGRAEYVWQPGEDPLTAG